VKAREERRATTKDVECLLREDVRRPLRWEVRCAWKIATVGRQRRLRAIGLKSWVLGLRLQPKLFKVLPSAVRHQLSAKALHAFRRAGPFQNWVIVLANIFISSKSDQLSMYPISSCINVTEGGQCLVNQPKILMLIRVSYRLLYPPVGNLHPLSEWSSRLPAELLPNEFVVRVSASDPERARHISYREFLSGYVHNHLGELKNTDHFL
jgi:hypothetical protein